MPARKRKKAADAASRGLTARGVAQGSPSAKAAALREAIESDGGAALALWAMKRLGARSIVALVLPEQEPDLLTLGVCYERNGRFAGGASHSILERVDEFSARPLREALATREKRAARLMELEKMIAGGGEFRREPVKAEQVARTAGAPEEVG